jgi:tetratricopeptide (TPR) repeat protein
MARDDWFRRTTWSALDAADFQARLKRSRGNASKAQYLRIQAVYLAEAGNHEAALSLLDQQLRDHPTSFETTQSLLQRAQSLDALDHQEEAIASYRASLKAQTDFPNVRSGVELYFAWFVVMRKLASLYDDALRLLEQYESRPGIRLPVEQFRCAVVRAFIADERGQTDASRHFAVRARQAAAADHSGLRYHPKLGLAEPIDSEVAQRLAAIGGADY